MLYEELLEKNMSDEGRGVRRLPSYFMCSKW